MLSVFCTPEKVYAYTTAEWHRRRRSQLAKGVGGRECRHVAVPAAMSAPYGSSTNRPHCVLVPVVYLSHFAPTCLFCRSHYARLIA
jgi:hypothetical protein